MWTARQAKTGLSFSFYWNYCKTGVKIKDLRGEKEEMNEEGGPSEEYQIIRRSSRR